MIDQAELRDGVLGTVVRGYKAVPYQTMIRELERRIKRERSGEKREEYQVMLTILLGIVELQQKVSILSEMLIKERK